MTHEAPLFILAGNGSYNNRGCEAIVRGTAKIIRNFYENPSFLCITQYTKDETNKGQFKKQLDNEIDKHITHKRTMVCRSISDINWIANRLKTKLSFNADIYDYIYKEMYPYISNSEAVLSIGGDNYAIDFGFPKMVTRLDEIVLKKRKPLIIWGASVGPFDKVPEYEKYMANHLPKVTAIFARETVTANYLAKLGVKDNVYEVTDPAFLMDPTKPSNPIKPEIKEGSIGINLSPLMAKYVTNGNIEEWKKRAAEIIISISRNTSRTIYLIPHVTTPGTNDYTFMKDVLSIISEPKENIILIPPVYNASETKWIISKMHIFAGSRTHSTIASLSSMVPTLSFAYSIKAIGINKDIFGNNDYCLNSGMMSAPVVVEKIEEILYDHSKIVNKLKKRVPVCEENALAAGKYLHEILES